MFDFELPKLSRGRSIVFWIGSAIVLTLAAGVFVELADIYDINGDGK